MTTPDLTNLGLDASQQACLRAMLEDSYRAGFTAGRARRPLPAPRWLTPVPAVLDEWVIPDLTDVERAALVAGLGTS